MIDLAVLNQFANLSHQAMLRLDWRDAAAAYCKCMDVSLDGVLPSWDTASTGLLKQSMPPASSKLCSMQGP